MTCAHCRPVAVHVHLMDATRTPSSRTELSVKLAVSRKPISSSSANAASLTSSPPSAAPPLLPATAFFDVDGTIAKTNIVMPFVKLRLSELSVAERAFWVPLFAVRVPLFLILDRINRSLFNKYFYTCYAGRSSSSKKEVAHLVFESYLKTRVLPGAVQHIQELKAQGWKIVLVTGNLDFIIQPLAEDLGVDDVIAARLEEDLERGRFTGQLLGEPISDEEKMVQVREYARERGLDLAQCRAYGDSFSDIPMLTCVGHPIAVCPDLRLQLLATKSNWTVLRW